MSTQASLLIIALVIGNICNVVGFYFLVCRVSTLEFLVRHLMEERS